MSKTTKKFHHLDEDGSYRVGYCKPPKATQFQKGVSPNPKGRKPRVPYEADDFPIRRFMMEPVEVKIKGKTQQLARFDILLMSLITKAMGGCFKSQKLLIQESGGLKAFREEWKRVKTQADMDAIDEVYRMAKEWLPDKSGE